MIKKTIGFPGEKKFKFYAYDPRGREVVIVMWAMDQTEAWIKFDRIYGEQTPVDKVEMIGE
jgi:hypothetical protein